MGTGTWVGDGEDRRSPTVAMTPNQGRAEGHEEDVPGTMPTAGERTVTTQVGRAAAAVISADSQATELLLLGATLRLRDSIWHASQTCV